METNGSRPLAGVDSRVHRIMDLKCPSSGMADHNYLKNLEDLTPGDELKFVVADRQDFDWALETMAPHGSWKRHQVLVSPVFRRLAAHWTWLPGFWLPNCLYGSTCNCINTSGRRTPEVYDAGASYRCRCWSENVREPYTSSPMTVVAALREKCQRYLLG